MGADNWTKCPNCSKKATDAKASAIAKVQKSYGKVPSEKFMADLAAANATPDEESAEPTLREDYSIGVEDGVLEISYSCSCKACSFSFRYKKNVDVFSGKED